MEIRFTKFVWKHITKVIGAVTVVCVAALSASGKMLEYYCVPGTSYLFNLSFIQGTPSCTLEMFVGIVVISAISSLILPLIGSLIVDFICFVWLKIQEFTWEHIEKPKIKGWFELPEKNNLVFLVKNPKGGKDVNFKLVFDDYRDRKGRSYLDEYRHELRTIRNSYGSRNPIYETTLVSNDLRKIDVGFFQYDKDMLGNVGFALYLGEVPVIGLRDGIYEYTLRGWIYWDGGTFSNDYKTWIIIKNGELIQIKDEL